MKVKKIEQEITKEQYERYHKMDIWLMRNTIKNELVPEEKWKSWCGASLLRLDGKYIVLHHFDGGNANG